MGRGEMTDDQLNALCLDVDNFLFEKIITEKNDVAMILTIVLGRMCVIAHTAKIENDFKLFLKIAAQTKIEIFDNNTDTLH